MLDVEALQELRKEVAEVRARSSISKSYWLWPTNGELARAADVTEWTVSRWLNRRHQCRRIESVVGLADWFSDALGRRVNATELLEGLGEEDG